MLLSDGELQLAMARGELVISPQPPDYSEQYQAASIDLRLGPTIWVQKDPDENESSEGLIGGIDRLSFSRYIDTYTEETNIANIGGFVLRPGHLVIAQTLETVKLSASLSGQVEGRSRLARMGIGVHLTAPKIDPGFDSNITLEIFHVGRRPVLLQNGIAICTLLVERLGLPTGRAYRGMFQHPDAQNLQPPRS